MTVVTVIKNDHTGRETWRYQGRLLERGASWLKLEAFFNRPDVVTPYHTFCQGDRFIEWFYSDRWYNIFEMHAATDDRLLGWYCNVTRPARLTASQVQADDLALDLFVAPGGAITLLDEDEFASLTLDDATRRAALCAVETLSRRVAERQPPFDAIR